MAPTSSRGKGSAHPCPKKRSSDAIWRLSTPDLCSARGGDVARRTAHRLPAPLRLGAVALTAVIQLARSCCAWIFSAFHKGSALF